MVLAFIPWDFDKPWWLWLALPLAALLVWVGRKSISGLSGWGRRIALVLRVVAVLLVVAALAEPHWRKRADGVAVVAILDVSRSEPTAAQQGAMRFLSEAARSAEAGSRLGVVTMARRATVQTLPGDPKRPVDLKDLGATDATNIEAGVRMGLALAGPDAATRLVIFSDGNETEGSLASIAQAARAVGVPIDVVPTRYRYDREVVLDRLVAPTNARIGENVTLRPILTSTTRTKGRLTISYNDVPLALDPATGSTSMEVELQPGTNPLSVPLRLSGTGAQRFKATFEPVAGPDGQLGDTIVENNQATAVTFVGGQGAVLVLTGPGKPEEAEPFLRALDESRILAEAKEATGSFADLADISTFEAIALVNVSASDLTLRQQEALRNYVHELGGGLVMIGGDRSFGAGGWIGSPLADALPIKLDPPEKRQMPRGALALVMHSCEMPNGNFWGRRVAEAAIDALSAQDYVGIIEADWGGPSTWIYRMNPVGDRSAPKRALQNMRFGDTQSFGPMLEQALQGLTEVQAGQRHTIIISDGDPQPPSPALVQKFVDAKITISTVLIFPHGGFDVGTMRNVAKATGGNTYEVTKDEQLDSLPKIFVKEAQTVKRSLIWEGNPTAPTVTGGFEETFRGIAGVPALTGYVVAADRDGLSVVTLRGVENDPVMAQWQYGLGRVVTFTSDLGGRWAKAWAAWGQFRPFWEQHTRWALRAAGSPNIRLFTEQVGDRTRLIVEALDDKGDRLNFLRWQGRAVAPDGTGESVNLVQRGPGRYEAMVNTGGTGSYTVGLTYEETTGGGSRRGSLQGAINRSFAEEFRSLRDNAGVLEQVAASTGGRVLSMDGTGGGGGPGPSALFDRAGLTMPLTRQPIWPALVIAAIGLFLMDVASRRLRIEPRAIAAWARGLVGKGKQVKSQADALRTAREKAARRMAQADAGPALGMEIGGNGERGGASAGGGGSAASAGVKFEASEAELRRARGAKGDAPIITQGTPPGGPVRGAGPRGGETPADAGEPGGLGRLKKAKKRAQEGMEEEG